LFHSSSYRIPIESICGPKNKLVNTRKTIFIMIHITLFSLKTRPDHHFFCYPYSLNSGLDSISNKKGMTKMTKDVKQAS